MTRRGRRGKKERKGKSQKKEDPGAQNASKVAKPFLCGSGRSKSRLAKNRSAKLAGAETADEK